MLHEIFFEPIYIILYEKKAFGTDFGLWEAPKPENLHFHFYAFSCWGTSQGPKSVPKAFSPRSVL